MAAKNLPRQAEGVFNSFGLVDRLCWKIINFIFKNLGNKFKMARLVSL